MSRDELGRLLFGPEPGQRPGGMGTVRFVVHCSGNAELVLAKCKKLLEIAFRLGDSGENRDNVWKSSLPDWFVNQCPREPSAEELEKFGRLPLEERARHSRESRWPLKAFANAFTGERWWFWWDAIVADPNTIFVDAEVKDWPFPWDLLRQVLCASGAEKVEAEE